MKIKTFEVSGLLGREGQTRAVFHDDINIITGRNGAGKTSLLKLLWYVISGNILIALREVPFSKCELTTSSYKVAIHRTGPQNCRVEMSIGDRDYVFEDDDDDDFPDSAEDKANPRLIELGSSVFFPTFRRIEGGFTLNPTHRTPNIFSQTRTTNRKPTDIEESLQKLSSQLSNQTHVFVSSISTTDIVGILLRKYADLSEIFNNLQSERSQEIIRRIQSYEADTHNPQSQSADDVLKGVKRLIERLDGERVEIMAPLTAVRMLVERLFHHTGINIGSRLSFGDAANAVNSEALSAGEKQMLSFICYNAFYQDSVFFIDEPELSLHVDWQRQLFPIMGSQGSENQFIIATHSPFIYSKYPDKEIMIGDARGDEGE